MNKGENRFYPQVVLQQAAGSTESSTDDGCLHWPSPRSPEYKPGGAQPASDTTTPSFSPLRLSVRAPRPCPLPLPLPLAHSPSRPRRASRRVAIVCAHGLCACVRIRAHGLWCACVHMVCAWSCACVRWSVRTPCRCRWRGTNCRPCSAARRASTVAWTAMALTRWASLTRGARGQTMGSGRPVQSKICALLFAARTLNATGQYRVTLSLR